MNAGALPVPSEIIQENTVGPTLGSDSIEKSKFAAIIGIGFVMLFMIYAYRLPGAIADVALIVYGLILFALFKAIPVTLTLAGIAGFILSVGMAVDANVLIYERIREEIRHGRPIQQAINEGYARAFVTIADSNITSFITALILFMVGTGAVKGFALVLMIGLASSMFTAVTACRAVVNIIYGGRNVKKLYI